MCLLRAHNKGQKKAAQYIKTIEADWLYQNNAYSNVLWCFAQVKLIYLLYYFEYDEEKADVMYGVSQNLHCLSYECRQGFYQQLND